MLDDAAYLHVLSLHANDDGDVVANASSYTAIVVMVGVMWQQSLSLGSGKASVLRSRHDRASNDRTRQSASTTISSVLS